MISRLLVNVTSHTVWTFEDDLDDLILHFPSRVIGVIKPGGSALLLIDVTYIVWSIYGSKDGLSVKGYYFGDLINRVVIM